MTKRLRYVAIDPDGEVVFNCKSQDCFFPSLRAAERAVREWLTEAVAEDDEGKIITYERDSGFSKEDFAYFVEVTK